MRRRSVRLLAAAMCGVTAGAPARLLAQVEILDSGGPMMAEQAAYDVTFYDLAIRVSPSDSSISGTVTTTARITAPIAWFVLDLDTTLAVHSVAQPGGAPMTFERRRGKLWIRLPREARAGESVTVAVSYAGRPRIAPRPPWDGGFQWARTRSRQPWIATSNQMNGSDLWWPSKDHIADKPDSLALHVTVPTGLVAATNGAPRGKTDNADGTTTFHWFVSTPINPYSVALNIAPYRAIERPYTSVTGETFPVVFYVLEEDLEKGERFYPEIVRHLRWFEETLGPYPFRADKYGVVQTPHLGMEHQSIIAYGANFNNGAMTGGRDWGFDALHHHELAHEWWGNLVTNADWADMWIHEGFGTYMQALYLESLRGMEGYHAYMNAQRGGTRSPLAVAPRGVKSAREIYRAPIYAKGAWVLHSLRFLVGDPAMREILQRMAYPDPALQRVTDGRQVRHATTDEFLDIAERVSATSLGWFFEVYLRQAVLPKLVTERSGDQLRLRWEVPNSLLFPMPVEVEIDGRVRRVEMPGGPVVLEVPAGAAVRIDPRNWVLMERSGP